MPLRALLGLVAVFPLLLPASALGWDETAHRAIARVAEENLGETALKRYKYYVPSGQTLEDVAYWAQSLFRERPETEAWHSITLPPDATGVDLSRDCPLDDCITVKIREAEGILEFVEGEEDAHGKGGQNADSVITPRPPRRNAGRGFR